LNINASNAWIANNQCDSNRTQGIESSVTKSHIINNQCTGNVLSGISVGGFTGASWATELGWKNVVAGNRCTSNGAHGLGIVQGTCFSNIFGNICMLNGGIGLYLQHALGVYPNTPTRFNVVRGNLVSSNNATAYGSPFGIYIDADHNEVSDNWVMDNAATGYSQVYGVYVTANGDYTYLKNNHYYGCYMEQYVDAGAVGVSDVFNKSEQSLPLAPTAGTATQGDIVWRADATSGQLAGWMCTHSGTFGAATDNTGDTDGASNVITGMTDTSDFAVGDYVDVSAGFASTGPYRIIAITATTITINALSNAAVNNITVDTSDPVWTAMANLA
jgi:hypothetical protein